MYHNVYNLCTDTTMFLSQSATVSLGLIGAGTNNARIAGMLRNLSSYYYKDASLLFCVCAYPLLSVLLRFSNSFDDLCLGLLMSLILCRYHAG